MTVAPYQLADRIGVVLGESRMVLWMGGSGIQRFAYQTNSWVDDPKMFGIFTGSPEVTPITEQQARGVIERSGGRWVAPSKMKKPELRRQDELIAQAQENANSVPIPAGADLIEDMGTVVPYWVADSKRPVLGKSLTVLWTGGNGVRIWRFDYSTDAWLLDPEIAGSFIGTPETLPITEEQARVTIERNGGTWAVPSSHRG